MQRKDCIAMLLAGGRGERLGALTNRIAKPAVCFGGKYRIIDFTLSNCTYSGIDSVGVLTQYKPLALHDYIGDGRIWDFNRIIGGVYMLPSSQRGVLYTGTADAVYQNLDFIEKFNPEHVLVVSGDHIYKMDYDKMLDFHKKTNADITISVVPVPVEEASRFGIMNIGADKRVTEFEEKPAYPKSCLASMGVYIFKWKRLKNYLRADRCAPGSKHDFGRNIIPSALSESEKLFAYEFDGYWRDVGTVQSLWESNMDLVGDKPSLNLYDNRWKILTRSQYHAPCYLSGGADVKRSIVAEGCHVYGKLSNSVLFNSVTVEEGAEVVDSILMPGAVVGRGAKVYKSIIGDDAYIGVNAEIGAEYGLRSYLDNGICSKDISLIGPGMNIGKDMKIMKNSHIGGEAVPVDDSYAALSGHVVKMEIVYA